MQLKSDQPHSKHTNEIKCWYKILGCGRTGPVILGDSPIGPVAIKFAPSHSTKLVKELQHEASIYRKCAHLQGIAIPQLFYAGPIYQGDYYGLCLQVLDSNLAGQKDKIVHYYPSAKQSLALLHKSGIAHNDLRLDNFCLLGDQTFIIDLGFATNDNDPEVLQKEAKQLDVLFTHVTKKTLL